MQQLSRARQSPFKLDTVGTIALVILIGTLVQNAIEAFILNAAHTHQPTGGAATYRILASASFALEFVLVLGSAHLASPRFRMLAVGICHLSFLALALEVGMRTAGVSGYHITLIATLSGMYSGLLCFALLRRRDNRRAAL